jgi:4-amino-4-deoxy-L-arabinose transferase-like glycosyltransferase
LLSLSAFFYLTSVYKIATSKDPFIDEGWIASPGYNLAFKGNMGTTVLEPSGSWLSGELTGIHEATYWIMPLHPFVQAGWYRLFGFGIVQMRLLSALWGLIAIAAWFVIVRAASGSSLAASLACLLLSLDFTFLWSAADGRMDMMCVALGLAGIALYMAMGSRDYHFGLLLANCCIAASIFTHPNGCIWLVILLYLVIRDRRKARIRDIWALIPYLMLGAAWGLYAAQHPDYFIAQMGANMRLPMGSRGDVLLHPKVAVLGELVRYIDHFGAHPIWASAVPRFAFVVLCLYWLGCLIAVRHTIKYKVAGLSTILKLLGICILLMAFLDSLKAHNYLSLVMPFYAAVVAMWTEDLVRRHSRSALPAIALCVILAAFQVFILRSMLSRRPLQTDYQPLITFLNEHNGSVTGSAALAFGLGYDRLTDDARLGEYSGKSSDFIIVDQWYQWDWSDIWPHSDPAAARFVRERLNAYRLVWTRGDYRIYERQ